MAWRCSGASNAELVANLFESGIIESPRVRDAMLAVDRAHYTSRGNAYADAPQAIGHAATISAPHMHAHALQALLPALRPGAAVLDVGAGSGYLTHVLAQLVCPIVPASNDDDNAHAAAQPTDDTTVAAPPAPGTVTGIDHIQPLVDLATHNMRRSANGAALLASGRVQLLRGDGRAGYAAQAPYDAIHVGAAAAGWPEALLDQLAPGGRMFIPVEEGEGGRQFVFLVERDREGVVSRRKLFGVQYVPLKDAPA